MSTQTSPKLSFRAVEVFVSIVEEQSITSAAKRLGASPSAVSLQLSNLEAALGTKLIERSSQRFSLTAAGELFHPRALRILDEVSSASAILSKSNVSPRITLKLAIIEDFDALVVAPWVNQIRKTYPNLRLNMRSGPSHESHEALGNRSADMIVAVEATDSADWVEEHSILNDPYILVTSKELRNTISLEALMKHPFIRYSREQLMGRQVEAHLRRNKSVPPRENEFSSNQMVFSMVAAQRGWTITSAAAFASVPELDEKLIPRTLPIPAFSRAITLYARKNALGDLPEELATMLRESIEQTIVQPVREKLRSIPQITEFKTVC